MVTAQIRNLPHDPLTAPIAQILLQAAEDEELALQKLRNTFEKLEETEAAPPLQPPPTGTPETPAEQEKKVSFKPRDPTLFGAFGAHLVTSNSQRRQALEELGDLREEVSDNNKAAVTEFAIEYASLADEWSAFHRGYNDWRRTEGGCDRSQALETLGQFTLSFAGLGRQARELPGVAILRPLGELLVEAIEREERALRELRNDWRPFDADIYQGFDGERNAAGRLRRQVVAGLNSLISQYNLTVPGS